MTLLDTGPLVALFDPRDPSHEGARIALKRERATLVTTIPVLTEAFHLLSPGSRGSHALREFVSTSGVSLWYLDARGLVRALELMEKYADHPMDLADASLVVAAERLRARRIVTLDHGDFGAYRILSGHRRLPFQVVRC